MRSIQLSLNRFKVGKIVSCGRISFSKLHEAIEVTWKEYCNQHIKCDIFIEDYIDYHNSQSHIQIEKLEFFYQNVNID
jgi:hypothetical protein